jgi:hypothetical protein
VWSLAGVTSRLDRERLHAYFEALRRDGDSFSQARFFGGRALGRVRTPVREALLLELELKH